MKVKYLIIVFLFNSCLSIKFGNKEVKNSKFENRETIEFINSQENIDRGYPFSEATIVNGIIYFSGEIGTLPDGSLIAGGIVQETRQTLTNIKNKLEKIGGSMDDIFKCTCMLSDIKESEALENYGDIIAMVYREEYYEPETEDRGIAELILTSHRNGPVGTVKMLFEPQYGR